MTLTADEQELLNFGVGALPDWIAPNDPILTAAAKQMGGARAFSDYLFKQTLITTADGPTSTTPDWLNQHARDRGTSRQAGESNDALATRLRVVPDALTRGAILTAVNAVLASSGVSGQAALLELPRDASWVGNQEPIVQTAVSGGVFAHFGSLMAYTPAPGAVLASPILWQSQSVFPTTRFFVRIQTAANSLNNGTFEITGLLGNAILFSNPSGVNDATDTTAFINIFRADASGNALDGAAGFARTYVNRGYRVTNGAQHVLLLILPFGTDAGTQASILETVRLKKAAGFKVIVERRLNP